MKTQKNILVIGSRKREKAIKSNKNYKFHHFDFSYKPRKNNYEFDALKIINETGKYIENNQIDGIYFSTDIGSVIGSILCQKYNLPGPTLDATITCQNKYYTRELLDTGVKHQAIKLNTSLKKLPEFPFYLKAPTSVLGILGFTINNQKEFKQAIKIAKKELPKLLKPTKKLYKKYLDIKKFPLANKPILLLEELIKKEQITVDGYVYNNQPQIVAITDTNLAPDLRLIDNFSTPSKLPLSLQKTIITQACIDIKSTGLNNCAFNIEYWIDNNKIRLIEINSRAATCFTKLYKEAYNYDLYATGLKLATSINPKTLTLTPQKYATQYNITTINEGRADQLFNFDYPIPYPHQFFRTPKETIKQISEYGQVIAQIELADKSLTNMHKKIQKLRHKLLKSPIDQKLFD
ncbi:hypothetical protein COV81_04200 [Candidatus Peregrinibacteria bacterium CG11_big_fil_rev_8_21_14_0_20_41_10]|nr:MAG: hypothetical protein COV81_04200 [Candidatus Peregrinibacteria bacterium CG11_big_fil_rev_8_21_14_0_20_41_10]